MRTPVSAPGAPPEAWRSANEEEAPETFQIDLSMLKLSSNKLHDTYYILCIGGHDNGEDDEDGPTKIIPVSKITS